VADVQSAHRGNEYAAAERGEGVGIGDELHTRGHGRIVGDGVQVSGGRLSRGCRSRLRGGRTAGRD
jgi:hypothetical protein